MTYSNGNKVSTKPLSILYLNGSGCNLKNLKYLERKLFVKLVAIKYLNANKEWIVCRSNTLAKWRKAKSKAVWREDDLNTMPKSLLMSDQCLFALAKEDEKLVDRAKL